MVSRPNWDGIIAFFLDDAYVTRQTVTECLDEAYDAGRASMAEEVERLRKLLHEGFEEVMACRARMPPNWLDSWAIRVRAALGEGKDEE